MKRLVASIAFFVAASLGAQTRVASDFEIAQMQKQLAQSKDFESQISGHLNIGDLRSVRNETSLARDEYRAARAIAERERSAARAQSNIRHYADATALAGSATAKLGDAAAALALSDEALRYAADDAKVWNLRGNSLNALHLPEKAVAAARNAVTIATLEAAESKALKNQLDLAIYRYSLALSLVNTRRSDEAQQLLSTVIATLKDKQFNGVRRDIAHSESFEIYSTVRGDAQAYLSVLNRSQLLLGSIYEERDDVANARAVYRDVLAARSDDAEALGAIARLSSKGADRERTFAEAFDANPFSIELIREFQHEHRTAVDDTPTTGARVRKALVQMDRGEHRAARATLDALQRDFRDNDVVQYLEALNDISLGEPETARKRTIHVDELRNEVLAALSGASSGVPSFLTPGAHVPEPSESDFRSLLALFAQNRLTPEQRATLDKLTLTTDAMFDEATAGEPNTTVFASGKIEGVPFTFSEPTAFQGTFTASGRFRLTYRIVGATQRNGADALLLEPLKLEAIR
jgi:tetratricopeptide (TPR) repeat protein